MWSRHVWFGGQRWGGRRDGDSAAIFVDNHVSFLFLIVALVAAWNVLDAFFTPSTFDNQSDELGQDDEFGNQAASITSRFLFPGKVPFAFYMEYAGEDTSRSRDLLLGNSALSVGVDFPRLFTDFSLTYEVSEWQNGWYVHHIYQDGLTNEGRVIGHWGADDRISGDGVGAQTHMLKLGWTPAFGGIIWNSSSSRPLFWSSRATRSSAISPSSSGWSSPLALQRAVQRKDVGLESPRSGPKTSLPSCRRVCPRAFVGSGPAPSLPVC